MRLRLEGALLASNGLDRGAVVFGRRYHSKIQPVRRYGPLRPGAAGVEHMINNQRPGARVCETYMCRRIQSGKEDGPVILNSAGLPTSGS